MCSGAWIYFKQTSIITAIIIAFKIVPIPGFWSRKIHKKITNKLIKKVIIPIDNKKDLVEIPKNVIDNMEIIGVKNVEEVLKHALVKELKPIKWAEIDQVSNKNKEKSEVTSTH